MFFVYIFEDHLKEFFVNLVLDPMIPFEERHVLLERLLIHEIGVNCANHVHMWTIDFDGLTSKGEEFVHRIPVQKVFQLGLVFE